MFEAVEDAFRYDRLVLAAQTYDGGLFPAMDDFLHHLLAKSYQKRTVGLIENGSWGPMAAKKMREQLEEMKEITILEKDDEAKLAKKIDKVDDSEDEESNDDNKEDDEEETELEEPHIEYSVQTDVEGYKIKLEAYNGVFPEGEELTLSANQIEDQEILAEIDSKLSNVCEGKFEQISFDIKVLNAAGEELQPDRSKYIENEDIIPIQLSIEFANDEIEGIILPYKDSTLSFVAVKAKEGKRTKKNRT